MSDVVVHRDSSNRLFGRQDSQLYELQPGSSGPLHPQLGRDARGGHAGVLRCTESGDRFTARVALAPNDDGLQNSPPYTRGACPPTQRLPAHTSPRKFPGCCRKTEQHLILDVNCHDKSLPYTYPVHDGCNRDRGD